MGLDIKKKIKELVLKTINQKIRKAIQGQGLDPYQNVAHFDANIGKIEYKGIGVSADASLSLSNLRGLSSLEMTDLTFTDGDFKIIHDSHVTGDFAFKFNADLTLDIEGKITAGLIIGSLKESVEAELIDSGASLTGSANFTFGKITSPEIKDVHLNVLQLDIGDVKVNINGSLGVFEPLANKFISFVEDKFKEEVQNQVMTGLKLAIQKVIDAALPIKLMD